jgi:GNAT acetyltransferase
MERARRLWEVQLRLECKALDGSGRIVRIDGPDPDPIPSCMVVRFHDGSVTVFADAVEPVEVDPANAAAAAEAIGHGRPVRVERFSTYAFRPESTPSDPGVVRKGREAHAVVVDGREVSWASSSRSNDEAAELWVRTDEAARRRGYALLAARAWAAEVTGEGRTAFYSHRAENAPSRHLAAKLDVVHLFDAVTLTVDD